MRIGSAISVLVACLACATPGARAPEPLQALGPQGEVKVYLLPLPVEAERLSFTLASVALRRKDGGEVPLTLAAGPISGDARGQRLLAAARVPPADYAGLVVEASAATLTGEGEPTRLVVDPAVTRPEVGFRLGSGQAVVLWATLKLAEATRGDYGFTPAVGVSVAPQTPPQVALYCTATGEASVTVADRRTRLTTGAAPVGARPLGIVLDRTSTRAYVALDDADELEVLDVAASESMGRIRLTPGDGPLELGTTTEGTLLVLNARARTLAFVDPVAMSELGRVDVGDAPSALLVDRSGRRAYVANRGTSTVTVVDTARRVVVGTLATEPEPVGLALSRDASRLHVIHRGSPYVTVFAIPSLAPAPKVHVGLGTLAIKVDPRTDLVYLARVDGAVTVHDPLSLQQVERLELPGPVTRMAIDDVENTLFALVPERRVVAVVELTSRRLLAQIPVGESPFQLVFAGERR